jgi:hypothetical protein
VLKQSLVFNVSAIYKDPLLIKKDTHFMGFIDKKLYVYQRVVIPKVKTIDANGDPVDN